MLEDYPAFVRAYDILFDAEADVRPENFVTRRSRLAELVEAAPHDRPKGALVDDLSVSVEEGVRERVRTFSEEELLKPLERWFFGHPPVA